MYNTQVYLYNQDQLVILNDYSNSKITSVRWAPVYAKDLKLHKGTDNVLTFRFVNQDQKPVSLTDTTVTFRLINREGEELILTKDLEMLDAVKGKAKVTITEAELDQVVAQKAHYSLERKQTSSAVYNPGFMDDDAGARGVVEILDSVMPLHTSSNTVTIPDHGNVATYNSSTWLGNDRGLQTLQYTPSSFTGNLQVEGAVDDSGQWYDVESTVTLSATSTTGYININGFHPYLRLNIEETSGNITDVKIR